MLLAMKAGVWTAIVTPFDRDKLDENAFRALMRHQVDHDVSGVIVGGTTGESATLTEHELARLIKWAVEESQGRAAVWAGAGSNATSIASRLVAVAEDAGAEGVLVVCPYYNKPGQHGLEAHFRAVAASTKRPVMLYNVPGRTCSDLLPPTIERLCDVSNIVAVKEASGDIRRISDIIRRCGDRMRVFCGEDELAPAALALGAQGVVSVTSNITPDLVAKVCADGLAGSLRDARALHDKLMPLHRAMFIESNPGPVKAALHALGWLAPTLRLPLVWPSENTCAQVREALETLANDVAASRGIAAWQSPALRGGAGAC